MSNLLHINALTNYVYSPKNAEYNFTLGRIYEEQGHTASAVSFYLRAAEFGCDVLLSYESLLRIGLCFQKQGSRVFLAKGIYLRAISLITDRPEAYFLLCRLYEHNKDWQEAYTWACMGENMRFRLSGKLKTDVEYPGAYGFIFEKAVSAWWIGLWDESLHLFRQLNKRTDMLKIHVDSVKYNLKSLASSWKDPIAYDASMYEDMRVKFNGLSEIKKNYSQCYQDLFVLTMTEGKRDGKFLEIGSGDPFFGNNSALLAGEFGWTGTSVDINKEACEKFASKRSTRVINADATKLDYNKILDEGDYDYLQIDCEPAITSFNVLKRIPFEKHRFAVITFEHDFYADEESMVREKSRKYLQSFGYILVAGNIAPDKYCAYEDWWIHPKLVSEALVYKMQDLSDRIKKADDYMFGKL